LSRSGHSYHIVITFLILLFTAGCSVEKNTGTTRFYHSLTARYNIYFNGYQSYLEGIEKVNLNHKDDFGERLVVFEYSDPASAEVCAAEMERAIMKASKLITLKSITAKPKNEKGQAPADEEFLTRKEYNQWVDDSYLLMAKARFYIRDYEQARATIAFNNEISTDPDVNTEGAVWLARIQIESGNLSEAGRILSEIGFPESLSPSLQAMYFSTLADINIRQERFDEAIDPLSRAIEYTKSKRQKFRYTFLLAQLYGEAGESEKAIAEYNKVIKMRPPYEVEFNAKVNIALVYNASAGNSENIRNDLLSMLKDDKNKDYLDQIYYGLGRLSENEGNTEEALDYFKQATKTTGISGRGKGRAYLALAAYYYDIPDYLNSKNYYDSALIFLDSKYPGYNQITSRANNLGELVVQLEIVRSEDSLRRVASMSEGERSMLIAQIIETARQEEIEAMAASSDEMYNLGVFYENERRNSGNIVAEQGQWYFYNQVVLANGRTEFARRWSGRPLEDNWRRRNKRVVLTDPSQPDIAIDEIEDAEPGADDPRNPEYYLRGLPLNDSLFKISEEKTALALYSAGNVYIERFDDIPRATQTWMDLIARFPGNILIPQTYYELYLLYRESDPTRAETFRQALLTRFSESEFALILTDPDFFRKKTEADRLIASRYEEAYNQYKAGNLEEARIICERINSEVKDHPLTPKVRLLYAIVLGSMNDEKGYRENLVALTKDFPGTEEAKKASEMISVIDKEMPELKVEEDRIVAAELYIYEPETPHLFVLLIEDPDFNINQATFDVINYNIDNYTNKNFRAAGELVDNKFIIITVGQFTSAADAFTYFSAFKPLTTIRNSKASTTKTFIITSKNLQTLLTDKDPARYMVFFKEKYNIPDNGR